MKNRIVYNLIKDKLCGSCLRRSLLIAVFSLLTVLPLAAQEVEQPEDFWFGLGTEMNEYSPTSLSWGISFTIAYGSGTSMGIKTSLSFDLDKQMNVMELDFLLRFYFSGRFANSGLFAQLEGGPAIYFDTDENISFPVRIGMFNIGLGIGWRFLLWENFFIEPYVRGGYPYLFGAGVSAGMRFN